MKLFQEKKKDKYPPCAKETTLVFFFPTNPATRIASVPTFLFANGDALGTLASVAMLHYLKGLPEKNQQQ